MTMRVFDALIANTDRNKGNLLIDKDWRAWYIDHTRAFRRSPELLDSELLVRCDRRLLAALRALDPATVRGQDLALAHRRGDRGDDRPSRRAGRAVRQAADRGLHLHRSSAAAGGDQAARRRRSAACRPLERPPQALAERHDRRVAEQPGGLADVGLRIADVAGAGRPVARRQLACRPAAAPRRAAAFSEMRPLVATLITSPATPGATAARSTPSTVLAT